MQEFIRGGVLRFILSIVCPSVWRTVFYMWLCADEYSPYMGRRTSSTLSLTSGSESLRVEPSGSQSVPPRKRLLKAPSLAELDSSDSDVGTPLCSCVISVKMHLACAEQVMIEVLVYSVYFLKGWDFRARISEQLQCGHVFDGWYVPRVGAGEEKWVRNYVFTPEAQSPLSLDWRWSMSSSCSILCFPLQLSDLFLRYFCALTRLHYII